MRRNEIPCPRDCPERSPTCHGTCERYAAAVEREKQRRDDEWKNSTWTYSKGNAAVRAVRFNTKKDRGVLH